ncbi:hypothetical protein NBRC10512v2_005708 [Rhodotorula toruloides]|nr:hypothetical protein OF846_003982 [Rhodotorula toruloides]
MCTPTPTTFALAPAHLLSPHHPSSPSTPPRTALPIDTVSSTRTLFLPQPSAPLAPRPLCID